MYCYFTAIYQYVDASKDINTFFHEVREQEEVRVLEESKKEWIVIREGLLYHQLSH